LIKAFICIKKQTQCFQEEKERWGGREEWEEGEGKRGVGKRGVGKRGVGKRGVGKRRVREVPDQSESGR
jgi:hypothetical protein